MGNDNGGFHESDGDDDPINNNRRNDNNNNNNNGQQHNYLPDPSEDKDENDEIGIYQSQYHMNLYGVTDSGEFENNALKRIPKDNHVRKIKQIFKYKKKLGEGASGKVLLAVEKFGDQKKCALKELNRKHRVNAQLFLREVVILESLQHPNILELYGIYLDKSSYFIATAYYSGGEFFDRIIKIKKFSEKQALKYIKPILGAVSFMHDKAIVHRDLKPSNMVFDKKGKNGSLKIIDFGTSEIVIDDDIYSAERVGTILYAPPEWKKDRIGSHIKKGDLWSLGVIVYVLMVGRLPFGEWKHIEQYQNDLWFPKKLKKKLSYQCIDFILKLLQRYPEQRLSAQQALTHPWISSSDKKQKDEDLGAELKHGLRSVHAENTISRVIGKVNYGALSINDLNKKQKAIVFDNIKNQKDVEKYLNMYDKQQNNQPQQVYNNNNNNNNKPAVKAYGPPPQIYNNNKNKYHPPPVFNGGNNNKNIMQSIHMFREQDVSYQEYKQQLHERGALPDANLMQQNGIIVYNEDLDDREYEDKLEKTLSILDLKLSEEQKTAELKDMLGDDYFQLRPEIDRIHTEEQENLKQIIKLKQLQQYSNHNSELNRQITHKNKNNPLNIRSEQDEEFQFDQLIVQQLMQLGLATKHACVRAVLATESKGVNQAAEWLITHQQDKGINNKVDVL